MMSAPNKYWRTLLVVVVMGLAAVHCADASTAFRYFINKELTTPDSSGRFKDPKACTSVGQVVQTNCGLENCDYLCKQSDLLNTTTAAALNAAVEAVMGTFAYALKVYQAGGIREGKTDCAFDFSNRSYAMYDFVLFLTLRPIVNAEYAVPKVCMVDLSTNRPTVGSLIIPASTVGDVASLNAHLLNCMLRLLVFDWSALGAFRIASANKTYYDYDSNAYPNGPVRLFNLPDAQPVANPNYGPGLSAISNSVTATTRLFLITPNVVATAQRYFNCPSLVGLPLEEKAPTRLAFERRVVQPEALTSDVFLSSSAVLSVFTVALLMDSGMYDVTMDTFPSEPLVFGFQKGCGFVYEGCNNNHWGSLSCNGTYGLNPSGSGYGACKLSTAPSLAPAYQHFPSDPTRAGSDPYADYCPYMTPEISGLADYYDCTVNVTMRRPAAVDAALTGRTSRAAQGWLSSQSLAPSTTDLFDQSPTCLPMICFDEQTLLIRIGDSYYPCTGTPFPGYSYAAPSLNLSNGDGTQGLLELTYRSPLMHTEGFEPLTTNPIPATDYWGRVVCPPAPQYCSNNPNMVPSSLLTEDSSLYRGNETTGYLVGPTWPQLKALDPANGTISGGTRVTVTGYNLFRTTPPYAFCSAIAVGGQVSDPSSFQTELSPDPTDPFLQAFSVTTSSLQTDKFVWVGGPEADRTGLTDVELLCVVTDLLRCEGSIFGNDLCGMDRASKAFQYTQALPEDDRLDLGFVGTPVGQFVCTLAGILILIIAVLIDSRRIHANYEEQKAKGAIGAMNSANIQDEDGEDMLPVAARSTKRAAGETSSSDNSIHQSGAIELDNELEIELDPMHTGGEELEMEELGGDDDHDEREVDEQDICFAEVEHGEGEGDDDQELI